MKTTRSARQATTRFQHGDVKAISVAATRGQVSCCSFYVPSDKKLCEF